jgi:hypothetical protein
MKNRNVCSLCNSGRILENPVFDINDFAFLMFDMAKFSYTAQKQLDD